MIYDAGKDAVFYRRPASAPCRLKLMPGRFAVFFPPDAHSCLIQTGEAPAPLKKVVVKVALDLLKPA